MFPTNRFYSEVYPNLPASQGEAVTIINAASVPVTGHLIVLGVTCANKSTVARGLYITIQKDTTPVPPPTYLLFNVGVPASTSLQVIESDKLVLTRGDTLKAWADSATLADLVVSYVIYTPSTTGT